MRNGEIEFAKEQAKEAMRIEKSDPTKFARSTTRRALSGFVAMWAKDWPAAKDYFQQLWIEAPADPRVKNNLALALVELGDKDRALNLAFDNYRSNKDSDLGAEVVRRCFGYASRRTNSSKPNRPRTLCSRNLAAV